MSRARAVMWQALCASCTASDSAARVTPFLLTEQHVGLEGNCVSSELGFLKRNKETRLFLVFFFLDFTETRCCCEQSQLKGHVYCSILQVLVKRLSTRAIRNKQHMMSWCLSQLFVSRVFVALTLPPTAMRRAGFSSQDYFATSMTHMLRNSTPWKSTLTQYVIVTKGP